MPPGTGYVNLERYLQLNQGAGQQMAGGIAGGLQHDADAYRTALGSARGDVREGMRGQGLDIASRARMAGDPAGYGVGTLLGQGKSGYTTGERGLDAFLANAEGGNQLRQASGAYGHLGEVLGLDAYNKGIAGGMARPMASPAATDVRGVGIGATPPRIHAASSPATLQPGPHGDLRPSTEMVPAGGNPWERDDWANNPANPNRLTPWRER